MGNADLIIPKHRVDVQICDDRGRIHVGSLFLAASGGVDQSDQRVRDLLSERNFLPVRQGESIWFIRRTHICWIKLPLLAGIDELDREVEQSSQSVTNGVILEFVDGSSIRGTLRYLMPETERRVGDFIEQSKGFINVRTEDDLFLVNLDRVVRLLLEE